MSLRELYPSGPPTLEQHHDVLTHHARKLETGVQQDQAATQRLSELREDLEQLKEGTEKTLDKIDREMSEQTQKLINIELVIARRDGETKRMGAWVALATPVLAVLGTLIATYLSRPAPGPAPIHLTSEQMQQFKDNEAAAKR